MRKERVACYIRVSSEEQKLHGISLDAQEDKLRCYAEAHNLDIVAWYRDEGVSGRKLIRNRPQLQQMIKDKDNFDRILFIKLDRFFRSVAEYHEAMKLLDPVIWTATEEKYDLSNANGRAFVNMKLTIAELEADQTGERIRLVNDYKVKNGQALTGAVPLGFKVVKTDTGRRVVHDQDTKEQLLWVLKEYEFTRSLRATSFKFYDVWGRKMGERAISRLIKNTMLYGSYRGNDDYCEPYITKAEWDKLNSYAEKPVKRTKRAYLFQGLIKCPHCGSPLAGRPNNCAKIYYNCKQHIYRNCDYTGSVSEIKLEQMLLENIEEYFKNTKELMLVPKKSVAPAHDYKAELDRLNYSWQKGRISVSEYDKQYSYLSAQISKQAEATPVADFEALDKALGEGWDYIYNNLDAERKKAFWHSVLKEIHITWISYGEKKIDELVFNL